MGVGGGGAGVSDLSDFFFFTMNPNLNNSKKKKNFFLGGGGGGGVDGRTDEQAQTNLPLQLFNFFEVGDITMHKYKCTRYGPDKLNLRPFYHLTFKCDLDLQPA